MSHWQYTDKGQRTPPLSQNYRPAGRYVLLKRVVGGPLDGVQPGEGVYLTAEQATRLFAIIRPERKH